MKDERREADVTNKDLREYVMRCMCLSKLIAIYEMEDVFKAPHGAR